MDAAIPFPNHRPSLHFCQSSIPAQFATLVLGRADQAGNVQLVNAGHTPVLLRQVVPLGTVFPITLLILLAIGGRERKVCGDTALRETDLRILADVSEQEGFIDAFDITVLQLISFALSEDMLDHCYFERIGNWLSRTNGAGLRGRFTCDAVRRDTGSVWIGELTGLVGRRFQRRVN